MIHTMTSWKSLVVGERRAMTMMIWRLRRRGTCRLCTCNNLENSLSIYRLAHFFLLYGLGISVVPSYPSMRENKTGVGGEIIRVLIIITSIYPFNGPSFDHPCSHRLSDHSLPICWLCWDINYLVCNIGMGGGGARRHFQR